MVYHNFMFMKTETEQIITPNSKNSSGQLSIVIESLINNLEIRTEKVLEAMQSVSRSDFIDEPFASVDNSFETDSGDIIASPHIHARILEILKDHLKPMNIILCIDPGSAYLPAVFSKMMDDEGIVISVEHNYESYKEAIINLNKSHSHLLKECRIIIKEYQGEIGCHEYMPFDCIYVGRPFESIPNELLNQLSFGGRMMIPLGKYLQFIYLVEKDFKGVIRKQAIMTSKYERLSDKEKIIANAQISSKEHHSCHRLFTS